MNEAAGLWLWRSPRVEKLVDKLRAGLRDAPEDPVVPQRVVVGSKGMARWLTQELATAGGVCANVEFPFLQASLHEGLRQLLNETPEDVPKDDPDVLCWAVLAELHDGDALDEFPAVRNYLAGEGGGAAKGQPVSRRTWAWARATADILDRYGFFRPEWVRAWHRGQRLPADTKGPPEPWQAELWQRVSKRLKLKPLAVRIDAARGLIEGEGGAVGGPIHIFGIAAFPPLGLELIKLLARSTPVHLYALTPSHDYMGDLKRQRSTRLPGADRWELWDGEPPQNALLANNGRLYRDFQLLVEEHDLSPREEDENLGAPGEPANALQQLQHDVYTQRAPGERGRVGLSRSDRSVQLHACHGPTRQVEVLRDVVLGLLDGTDGIEPRDILVVTPDIATYAPLVELAFRRGPEIREANADFGSAGGPSIPVSVSDRSLTVTNPVADVLVRVLALADARLTASAVLDVLAQPAVQARLGLEEEDLPLVRAMVRDANIRWGEDAQERARDILGDKSDATHPLSREDQNTWAFGLARLALAVASSDDAGMFGKRLATADVEGDRVAVFGAFAAFARSLMAWRRELRVPATAAEWAARLRGLLDDLVDVPAGDAEQLAQVHQRIDDMAQRAAAAGFAGTLTAGAVHRALQGEFDNPRGGDRPITGGVTVCSMTPMRSIPFKAVVLLGLKDGEFPRLPKGLGVDAVASRPRLGDRNPRDEDRHEFLEALLCARHNFVVIYAARDQTTNEELAPCAPVAELIETLDATFTHPDGEDHRASAALRVEHPLQPFSARNFRRGAALSYDQGARALAEALREVRQPPAGLFGRDLAAALPKAPRTDITVEELVAFFKNPAKHLLRTRLAVNLDDYDDAVEDREPVILGALEKWQLGDEFLERALQAAGRATWAEELEGEMRAQGRLPLGRGAAQHVGDTVEKTSVVLAELRGRGAGAAVPIDVDVGGHKLTGMVGEVEGTGVVRDVALESPTKPKRLLRAWIRALAVSAARPGVDVAAEIIGINAKSDPPAIERVTLRVGSGGAQTLESLVDLYWRGMERPLRYALKSTHAYANALKDTPAAWKDAGEGTLAKAVNDADKQWNAYGDYPESADASLKAVFGDQPPWSVADAPGMQEQPAFVDVAERVWRPVFAGMAAPAQDEAAPAPTAGRKAKAKAAAKVEG